MRIVRSNKQMNGRFMRQIALGILLCSGIGLSIGVDGLSTYLFVALGLALALFMFGLELDRVPEVAITCCESELTFHHKHGNIKISYENIVRVDVPSTYHPQLRQRLSYVGIKLRDPEKLYEALPLRLASRLLLEQKDLQISAGKEHCSTGRCDIDTLVDQIEWRSPSGIIYTGVIGMFANRSEVLNRELGFHFYISEQAVDITVDKVVDVIRSEWQKVR